jgi:hypothetical protein
MGLRAGSDAAELRESNLRHPGGNPLLYRLRYHFSRSIFVDYYLKLRNIK